MQNPYLRCSSNVFAVFCTIVLLTALVACQQSELATPETGLETNEYPTATNDAPIVRGERFTTLAVPADATNAATLGAWSAPFDWPIIAIHAILAPDGKVLSYGTDEEGQQGAQFFYDVWDPESEEHQTLANTTGTDLFCSAQAIDPSSGDILITGGDARPLSNTNNGVDDINLFDYQRMTLTRSLLSITKARWYPTLTTLADGSMVLQGGRDEFGEPVITPERYTPGSGWSILAGADNADAYGNVEVEGRLQERWWYPRSFVAPDGRLFGISGSQMYYLDAEGEGRIDLAGAFPGDNVGGTSTAVMYRPGLILQVGGSASNNSQDVPASQTASIIDIRSGAPEVMNTQDMTYPRHWGDATVLPDGQVLVTGGSAGNNRLEGVASTAEIWNPDTGTWTLGAQASNARLYHSTVLLLPDATVLVAGGGAPGPLTNLNAERYYPPYLFNSDDELRTRPQIERAPDRLTYGEAFDVDFSETAAIESAALIRFGSVTHSFDMGQRYVPLSYNLSDTGSLRVSAPSRAEDAPPGYYMLFLIGDDGTPSVAKILQLGQGENPTNLIQNGGFEAMAAAPAGSWTTYAAGSSLGAWQVTMGNVDIQSNTHRNAGSGAQGRQHLDLNGSTQGRVSQGISGLEIGETYSLSFRYAIHPLADSATAEIAIADLSERLSASNKGDSEWLSAEYTFSASSSTHDLSFEGVGGLRYGGMLIDEVEIELR